jgi:hypothetical protein
MGFLILVAILFKLGPEGGAVLECGDHSLDGKEQPARDGSRGDCNLGWKVNMPLAVVILSVITVTVALTALVEVIWRPRRRQQLTGTVELLELRGRAQLPAVTGGMDAVSGVWTVTDARSPRGSR